MKKRTIVKLIIQLTVAAGFAWYYKGFIGGFILGGSMMATSVIAIGETLVKKAEAKKFAVNQALKKVINTLEEAN